MSLKIYLILFYIQTALSGVVVILCFLNFSKRNKTTQLIGFLFLIGFLCNVLAYFGPAKFRNIPGSIYDLCLIAMLGILYNYITQKQYRKFFVTLTLFYLVFATANLLLFQRAENSSYNKLLSSFIIISYSVFYFYRLMIEMPATHIQKLPMFWFNAAFLFYHAGTIFLFAFTTYIIEVLNDDFLLYWSFHNSLSILEHFILIIGLSYDFRGLTTQIKRNQ